LKVFSDGLELGRDLVGAPANTLAANLAAIGRYEPENICMALAAERAITVAHDASSDDWPMPQSE
jgi:hypothetical protein